MFKHKTILEMKNLKFMMLIIGVSLFTSCIKDDFVEDTIDPILRITTILESIEINSEFQFEALYLNNVGQEEDVQYVWSSSDANIISMSKEGLATAVNAGTATVKVEYSDGNIRVEDEIELTVGEETVEGSNSISGKIKTTSSYVLEGEFVFSETSSGINIAFSEDYKASSALPGLFVYLSNNKNSIADALEISDVKTFSGAHEYNVTDVAFNEYKYLLYFCKPFNVKVGDGELDF